MNDDFDSKNIDFLSEFDKRDKYQARQWLFHWMCNHQNELLKQLRVGRPVLEFYSLHPGNPIYDDTESDKKNATEGYAYFLSDPGEVRQALSEWSMDPHKYSGEFVLAIDDEPDHQKKRRTLVHKLQDPAIAEHIDAALELGMKDKTLWVQGVGDVPSFDVLMFARRVALRFTGSYFGLSDKDILAPGVLEQASAAAFRQYIWKIHARHFVEEPTPDYPNNHHKKRPAIDDVVALVAQGLLRAPADSVIGRFRRDRGAFSLGQGGDKEKEIASIVANIVGCIQGLIDNVTISACNAVGELVAQAIDPDPEKKLDLTVAKLRESAMSDDQTALRDYLLWAHGSATPAPYLPRYADKNLGIYYNETELSHVQVICATGTGYTAAHTAEKAQGLPQSDTADIRMGFGPHDCIGKYLGDEIVLGILRKVFQLESLASVNIDKEWGWIVRHCTVKVVRKKSRMTPISQYSEAQDSQYIIPGAISATTHTAGLVSALLDDSSVNISSLTNKEISGISASVFQSLSRQQLQSFTESQIRGMSYYQVLALDEIGRISTPGILQANQRSAVEKQLSYFAIKSKTSSATPRPNAFSLWSKNPYTQSILDYTTWPGLVDKQFTARHLPPATEGEIAALPQDEPYRSPTSYGKITALFKYDQKQTNTSRSSLLFPIFAQWFTDSFLSTNKMDRRRNGSTHQIDMCQIYGRTDETTRILRAGIKGKLKTQEIKGNVFPPLLFDDAGNVNSQFNTLPYVQSGQVHDQLGRWNDNLNRKQNFFVSGLAQGNVTFGIAALNTLFLREHNRVCDILLKEHSQWSDEQVFQTARMINILLEIKIVVSEYINHIAAPPDLDACLPRNRVFRFDHEFAEGEKWYRPNHMALEFNLVYRWHSLVPGTVTLNGKDHPLEEFTNFNDPLIENGLDGILLAASEQRIDSPGLFGTPHQLLGAEYAALKMARDYRVCSYNKYRIAFGLEKIESFEELGCSDTVVETLRGLYSHDVGKLELLVGLYAEKPTGGEIFGSLMTSMVAHDAFTQALTNPLLSRHVFTEKTISGIGMEVLNSTNSLDDIWQRNRDSKPVNETRGRSITMDFPVWNVSQSNLAHIPD